MHNPGLKRSADHHPLGTVDSDEELILDIKRHPIGIISLYILTGVGLFAAFMVIAFMLPMIMQETGADSFAAIAAGLMILITILVLLGLFVATYVYRQSRLMLTNKNITQIIQYSLFSRKTSQLSMANVEDVTAEQNGLVPSLFDYGTLKVETAGEQANFHFTYCPHPNIVAKEVLEARERYIEHPAPMRARDQS